MLEVVGRIIWGTFRVSIWGFKSWNQVIKTELWEVGVACASSPGLWWSKPELWEVGMVCVSSPGLRWSKPELWGWAGVGVAWWLGVDILGLITECKVFMAVLSKPQWILGSAIISLTMVSSLLNPSVCGMLTAVSVMGLRDVLNQVYSYLLLCYLRPLPFEVQCLWGEDLTYISYHSIILLGPYSLHGCLGVPIKPNISFPWLMEIFVILFRPFHVYRSHLWFSILL